jgi:hypothetical protein
MGSFDIRSAVAGRNYVTTQVPFWVEDKVFYDLETAWEVHKRTTDGAVLKGVEDEIERLEKQREAEKFTVFLRAISNRSNEDIISKALAAFPIKRDVYGREDEAQVIERGKLIREMQVAAHITKLIDPDGNAQEVNDENRRDVARALLDGLPPISLKIIDEAIKELNKDFQSQIAKQQDTDFLSKH